MFQAYCFKSPYTSRLKTEMTIPKV